MCVGGRGGVNYGLCNVVKYAGRFASLPALSDAFFFFLLPPLAVTSLL